MIFLLFQSYKYFIVLFENLDRVQFLFINLGISLNLLLALFALFGSFKELTRLLGCKVYFREILLCLLSLTVDFLQLKLELFFLSQANFVLSLSLLQLYQNLIRIDYILADIFVLQFQRVYLLPCRVNLQLGALYLRLNLLFRDDSLFFILQILVLFSHSFKNEKVVLHLFLSDFNQLLGLNLCNVLFSL